MRGLIRARGKTCRNYASRSRYRSMGSSPVPTRASTIRSASAACGSTSGHCRSRCGDRCMARSGEVNESSRVVEESLANIGATIMGRNMFGGHPGPWDEEAMEWLVGRQPAVSSPGVRAHASRTRAARTRRRNHVHIRHGRTSALEQARRAAGGKDVSLAGGRKAAQQYLAAGLVDEMELNVVPTLLGSGERLFEGIGDDLHGLELVRTIATLKVTHLKFSRR